MCSLVEGPGQHPARRASGTLHRADVSLPVQSNRGELAKDP